MSQYALDDSHDPRWSEPPDEVDPEPDDGDPGSEEPLFCPCCGEPPRTEAGVLALREEGCAQEQEQERELRCVLREARTWILEQKAPADWGEGLLLLDQIDRVLHGPLPKEDQP